MIIYFNRILINYEKSFFCYMVELYLVYFIYFYLFEVFFLVLLFYEGD